MDGYVAKVKRKNTSKKYIITTETEEKVCPTCGGLREVPGSYSTESIDFWEPCRRCGGTGKVDGETKKVLKEI